MSSDDEEEKIQDENQNEAEEQKQSVQESKQEEKSGPSSDEFDSPDEFESPSEDSSPQKPSQETIKIDDDGPEEAPKKEDLLRVDPLSFILGLKPQTADVGREKNGNEEKEETIELESDERTEPLGDQGTDKEQSEPIVITSDKDDENEPIEVIESETEEGELSDSSDDDEKKAGKEEPEEQAQQEVAYADQNINCQQQQQQAYFSQATDYYGYQQQQQQQQPTMSHQEYIEYTQRHNEGWSRTGPVLQCVCPPMVEKYHTWDLGCVVWSLLCTKFMKFYPVGCLFFHHCPALRFAMR